MLSAIFVYYAARSKEIKIESIKLSDTITDYQIGNSYKLYYDIEPDDADLSDLEAFSTDEDVFVIDKIENGIVYFSVVGDGRAKIFIGTEFVKSNLVNIIVEDSSQETISSELNDTNTPKPRPQPPQQTVQQEKPQEIPSQQENTQIMVYIASSGNGTKYHSNPYCSNMKGTIKLSIEEAIQRGYTPCKKCY